VIVDRLLDRDDIPFSLEHLITGQDLLQIFPSILNPLWEQSSNSLRGVVATVTTILTSPNRVTVAAGAETYKFRYLNNYTPTVGDTVLVLHNAKHGFVLGALA
jgi:hypothetical protein